MRKNFALKLFSLIVALMLDFYLHSPSNKWEVELSADIELRNLPSSRMVIWPKDIGEEGKVKVRIKGPEPLIDPLKTTPLSLFVDLPNPLPPRYLVRFNPEEINLPPGVDVVAIEPAHADLIFESVVKRELTVVGKIVGEVQSGFEIDRIRVYPATVSAKGPRTELSQILSIETTEINVSGWDHTQRVEVELQEPSSLVNLALNYVTVEIEVRPKQLERSFSGVPLEVLASPQEAAVSRVSLADISIEGEEKLVQSLMASQVKLQVDCRGLGAGRHLVPIIAILPDGVEVKEISPRSVLVNIVAKDER